MGAKRGNYSHSLPPPKRAGRADSFEYQISEQTRLSLQKKVRDKLAEGKSVTTVEAFLVLSKDENFDRADANTIRRSKRYLKAVIEKEKGEEHEDDIFGEEESHGEPDYPPEPQSKPFWFDPNESYE